MSFIYDKLFEKLKEKNISTYQLRQNGLSPTIINKLVHGQNVNTSTLEYFCKLLNCDIGDIMEYRPDIPDRTQTKKE
jgi:putative transcriptional regulator